MNWQNSHLDQANATGPTLQQGIDQAGSPLRLLWKPDGLAPKVPVVKAEFTGWAAKQAASGRTVAMADQSHHMRDLFVSGPDATRLLADTSVNNYEKFAVDQAKQYVAVNTRGQFVADSILIRTAEDAYTLTGATPAMSWVQFHAETGDYDVTLVDDPDSGVRAAGRDPVLYRYEIQGPRAMEMTEKVFGGPLPETKFFHSVTTTLDGRSVRALRHGMGGQPGYEFVGPWADNDFFKETLLKAGEEFDLVQVGGLAYFTTAVPSGWLATAAPAVHTDPNLRAYREWLGLYTMEGQLPLHGTFFSEDIEDYYVSPYELGYGRLMHLAHDFVGRDALVEAKDTTPRTKVTLVVDQDDFHREFGEDPGFYSSFAVNRIEAGDQLVGQTFQSTHNAAAGTLLAMSLVDHAHAVPGTEVTLVLGEHPGSAEGAGPVPTFARLRATVAPSPYDQFARTGYRQD